MLGWQLEHRQLAEWHECRWWCSLTECDCLCPPTLQQRVSKSVNEPRKYSTSATVTLSSAVPHCADAYHVTAARTARYITTNEQTESQREEGEELGGGINHGVNLNDECCLTLTSLMMSFSDCAGSKHCKVEDNSRRGRCCNVFRCQTTAGDTCWQLQTALSAVHIEAMYKGEGAQHLIQREMKIAIPSISSSRHHDLFCLNNMTDRCSHRQQSALVLAATCARWDYHWQKEATCTEDWHSACGTFVLNRPKWKRAGGY